MIPEESKLKEYGLFKDNIPTNLIPIVGQFFQFASLFEADLV